MLTPSLEDYLEELYRLCQQEKPVRTTDIAASLKVSLPSVTRALQKLSKAGYIEYKAYEEAWLTGQGTEVGEYLVERNRILREFVSLLHVECDVAEEVESMEHYISPAVVIGISRLVRYIQQPEAEEAFTRLIQGGEPMEPPPPAVTGLDQIKHLRRFGGKTGESERALR